MLPGHVPFMTALKPGVLSYRTKDGPRFLAVGDGVLQVARSGEGDRIAVLVDRGEAARGDRSRGGRAQQLAALDAELARSKAETAAEVKALLGRRAWAAARVDAAMRVK